MTTASIETSFTLIGKPPKKSPLVDELIKYGKKLGRALFFFLFLQLSILKTRLNMGSVHTVMLCSIILVLLPFSVANSFNLSPVFSPIFEDRCKHVECGKGTCKPSNGTVGYVCECEPGWKQTRPQHDDDLKFLSCVIPNCSLDVSCTKAPSPAHAKEKRNDSSLFDPCYWADCGGGTCNKTSMFTHKCECDEGYYNILNVTAFPCFKECALGMDCANLGINVMNKSASPPSLSENTNQATSASISDFNMKILVLLSLAFVFWK